MDEGHFILQLVRGECTLKLQQSLDRFSRLHVAPVVHKRVSRNELFMKLRT